MKIATNTRVLILACFALAIVPAFRVGAQTVDPKISFEDLNRPGLRPAFTFQSGLSKTTMGTISTDTDWFMSALEWSRMQSKRFGYAGIYETIKDETVSGILSGGFGGNFGKVYFGIGYNGNPIDAAIALRLDPPDVPWDNTLSVLIGVGKVGIKVGFSDLYLNQEGGVQESSMKPSFELGFNLPSGPIRIKPVIRGAVDIHNYRSKDDHDSIVKLENFIEPSAGITLGFDFGRSEKTRIGFDINADGALRFYNNDDKAGVRILQNGTPAYVTSTITDLRLGGSPAFLFSKDFNPRFTLGIKAKADIGFDLMRIPQADTTDYNQQYVSSQAKLAITPDIGIGINLNLSPERDARRQVQHRVLGKVYG
ncbi:hypothetical protein AGMMS49940_06780 [Spirochaetia bacterium]|nr:hypothetical protein AGMMS49940_06780 [Spirochaetia bacterium]